MRVAVLTTSYPRFRVTQPGGSSPTPSSTFVRVASTSRSSARSSSAITASRTATACSATCAGGPGSGCSCPALLASFVRAARACRRGPPACPLASGRLGRGAEPASRMSSRCGEPTSSWLARAPWLARRVLRGRAARDRGVAATSPNAHAPLGAREVRVIPSGVDLPPHVGEEAEPPEVLYAGRLSPEKGVLELVEAADGLNLVVAGDGPLRDRSPARRASSRTTSSQQLYARAAVVACPSRREGFGVACLEAMAHGRPVVATPVGGLAGSRRRRGDRASSSRRAIRPRCVRRSSGCWPIPSCGARLGAAGRERARERFSWDAVTDATLAAYAEAVGTMAPVKRALITGIGGQDGSYLAELLLEHGYAVAGVVRPGAAAYANLEPVRTGSSCSRPTCSTRRSLAPALERRAPARCTTSPSPSFVPASWEQPVTTAEFAAVGATSLLEAIRAVDPAIRFYQASSSEIFGEPRESPQTEDDAARPGDAVRRREGVRALHRQLVSPPVRPVRLLRDPLQPRVAAAAAASSCRARSRTERRRSPSACRTSSCSAISTRGATGATPATTSARCG